MPSLTATSIAGSDVADCSAFDQTGVVRLTAIVPATNRPATLRQCLDAIARATIAHAEVKGRIVGTVCAFQRFG